MIYLSISSIRLQLGDIDGSRAIFEEAVEVIRKKRRQFLMPGIGTCLFDNMRSDLHSRAGWIFLALDSANIGQE